jgi:pimeloyl-ACP methyl ester carboxylesterase
MQVTARGLTFDVHTGGPDTGEPALLLHGFPQHSRQWDLVTPVLHRAGIRTIALDQRGYSPGARPAGVEAYRMGECVADAVAILDALGLDTAHVVGHDWGAVVGWQLAARHPDRVTTLTALSVPHPLAMAAALGSDADQRQRSSYVRLFREQGKAEQVLLADDAQRLRAMLVGVPSDRAEQYVEPMRDPAALTAALNWYRAMSAADLAGLGPVTVPTTYLWSDGDIAIGRSAAEGCGAHVTGEFRFVDLTGVTHWVPDEAPAAVADAIVERIGQSSLGGLPSGLTG